MTPVEQPGFVLREYRLTVKDQSQEVFGELTGWGKEVQRRLEDGSTRFTMTHLKTLCASDDDLKKGNRWYQRFEAAMVGDNWPPPGALELGLAVGKQEGEKVVVPVQVRRAKSTSIVLMVTAVSVLLALTGFYGYRYSPWLYPPTYENWPPSFGGTGGGYIEWDDKWGECKLRTYVLPPSGEGRIQSSETYYADIVDVVARANAKRIWRIKVYADNEYIGWAQHHPEKMGPDRIDAGFFWMTQFLPGPGEYTIRAEFIPHWYYFRRVIVVEKKFTVLDPLPPKEEYKP